MKFHHNVHSASWSKSQPVHICCLFDPRRAWTLADPSSEDKAYVCSGIINACAETTVLVNLAWVGHMGQQKQSWNLQCHGKFYRRWPTPWPNNAVSSQNARSNCVVVFWRQGGGIAEWSGYNTKGFLLVGFKIILVNMALCLKDFKPHKDAENNVKCCSSYARPVWGAVVLPWKYTRNMKQGVEHAIKLTGPTIWIWLTRPHSSIY